MLITIDEKQVEFKEGQTILQAALAAEIDIPHFCWHPGLSVSGNCRICLVEVEKTPKLVIACSTLAQEGMIVQTKSEKVINAQNAVMEFLLINHPLDCPICDEAGECKLQDYAYKYSKGYSSFDEEKNHKDKRIDLGPNVKFDQERCISCSRCIRFCEEIAKDPQLTFVQRGEKVTIKTFPGKELNNPYSMNVIEICPVGALTSRHFRFRSRVWDMSFTNSICPGCARGCNTIIGTRNNEILRIEPRENLSVNDYWLCDWGRLNTIKSISDGKLRIDGPELEHDLNFEPKRIHTKVDWDEAAASAASRIPVDGEKVFMLASANSTIEDNYTFKKFSVEIIKKFDIYFIPNIDESFGDNILRKSDKTANSTLMKYLDIPEFNEDVIDKLRNGYYSYAVILNEDITLNKNLYKVLDNLKGITQLLSYTNSSVANSDVVFALSTYAEINGTFINFANRIQKIRPAITSLEQERLIGEFSMSRLDKFGAHNDRWTHGKKFNSRPGWKILMQLAKILNHDFKFENSEEVFIEFCNTVKGLEGLDYEAVGEQGFQIK
ncbi:MAG: (2Fe-2S)-binding protein [Ignavibacteria bacterium]|nr:(2Fe-2S)-binding protein [Ignavibacteria bacterium]